MKPGPVKPPTEQVRRSRVIERSPVYYGWLILLAATVGMIMTGPGQTFAVSAFLDPMIVDLGLSRSSVSLLYMIGTLVGATSLPFVGRFIDARGPRTAVIVVSSLFALACVFMSFVSGLFTLLIGFILIRGLGQGSLGLVSLHVINIWFARRRGLAIGLNGVGIAVATAGFPLLIDLLISNYGWRVSYPLLGAMVAAVMLPVGAIFYRSHPETYGLTVEGLEGAEEGTDTTLESGAEGGSRTTRPVREVNYTAGGARRTITFWLFLAGDTMVSALGTGLIFHHFSIMAANGVDRAAAATFFIPLGALSAGTVLLTGYLMDRMPPRYLLSASQMLLVTALFLAGRASSPELVIVYGLTLGFAQGMKGAIGGSIYAYYFGRLHLGSIKGSAQTISIGGTAIGPLLYALGFDFMGSYAPILLMSAVLPLAVAVLAPLLKPFRPDGSVV